MFKISNIISVQNRNLLKEMVRTDFKLRYQGSVLGYLWSLLRPLLLFLILYIVFAKFLRFGGDVDNFPVYLLLGIILWQFFADMTGQSLGIIVARGDLIRKISIPRWLPIVSTSILALINLGFNLVVVLLFCILSSVDFTLSAFLLPVFILEVYVFALGCSLYLSAAFVRYRDVPYIWEVLLQAGFYATPILYTLNIIGNVAYQKILLLNPMAQAIQDARYVFVTKDTVTIANLYDNLFYILIPLLFVLIVLVLGVMYFRNNSSNFAENL